MSADLPPLVRASLEVSLAQALTTRDALQQAIVQLQAQHHAAELAVEGYCYTLGVRVELDEDGAYRLEQAWLADALRAEILQAIDAEHEQAQS